MLGLHTLTKIKTKKRKRVGRGNASGHGTYSTRGIKGQRSRSGGKKGLKKLGAKQWLQKVPKKKGFTSPHAKKEIIKLADLEKYFNNGDVVTAKVLHKKGLINNIKVGVKVLSNGKLTKKLTVKADAFSVKAKEAIEKLGGRAEVVERQTTDKDKKDKKKQGEDL